MTAATWTAPPGTARPATSAATATAREALRIVQVAPREALRLAGTAASSARAAHDLAAEAVAERAMGVAGVYLGDLDDAIRHLRTAVAGARRAEAPELLAEARMSLAFALGRRGWSQRALREVDAALAGLRGLPRTRARVQRAAVLQQLGRLDEALAGYRSAVPALRRAGDLEWLQRALSNRAVVHAFQHAYPAADADLREAAQLCARLDLGLAAGFVEENLGFVSSRRGDVPAALRHLARAEAHYRDLGAPVGSLLVDRSELYLSVRLDAEAMATAEQAVAELSRHHRQVALPEARLLLSRAAVRQGDATRALAQARQAVRELDRQGRTAWAAYARLQVATARLADDASARVQARRLAAVADALEAARWSTAALEARLLAGRRALDAGDPAWARRQLQAASRRRHHGTAAERAHAWYGEALLRLSTGRPTAATSAATAGLRILDEHRATLGATDLRASAAGLRGDLTAVGLGTALQRGRADQVLRWAEHGRARHLLSSVRPPADPVLSRHLTELRATVAEVESARGAGRSPAALLRHQVELERAVRDHCRQRPGRGGAAAVTEAPRPRALGAALDGAALLELVELDGALHAVTVVDGVARLHHLGPAAPVRRLVEFLGFAVHRLLRASSGAPVRGATSLLPQTAAELDAVLLCPLADVLGDRPLVVVPTGALQSVPWATLPSCAGRPVTVAPSAALWWAATRGASRDGGTGGRGGPGGRGGLGGPRGPGVLNGAGVVAAAGPGLPGADAEVAAVARAHGPATECLRGAAATVEAVAAAMQGSRVAHLAAHGRVRGDNPLFTSLRLADGMLSVYDLEELSAVPATVVLAACDAGRSVVRAGDELLGLSASFLALGATALVAPVIPVPDESTTGLMTDFHRLLAAGSTVAGALAAAQQRAASGGLAERAAAAGFVCLGAGHAAATAATRSDAGKSPAAGTRVPGPRDPRAATMGGDGPWSAASGDGHAAQHTRARRRKDAAT